MGHSNIQKYFGVVIRDIRRKLGLSQEAFANLCSLDRTYIGGVERGERNISIVNIAIIASSLELNISDIFKLVEEVKQINEKY